MKIKCHVIEEHNEALIVWLKHIKNNEADSKKNVLIHFDDHSDMSIPKLDESIIGILEKSDDEIVDFIMRNISIETFIVAACYLEIFDIINWIQVGGITNSRDLYVTSYLEDDKNIISGHLLSEDNPLLKNKIAHRYTFNKCSEVTFDASLFKNSNFFLDIDLDYFSCEVNPNLVHEVVIQITKEEYDGFNSDFYHPIRYLVNRAQTMVQEGKFYLVINYYHDIIPSPRISNNKQILKRIKDLENKLRQITSQPKVITICKSVNSGYLPENQYEFIIKNLLETLDKIYDLEIEYGY